MKRLTMELFAGITLVLITLIIVKQTAAIECNNQTLIDDINNDVDLEVRLQKLAVDLSAAEIQNGRFESALKAFKAVNDDSKLVAIIKRAYNHLSDAAFDDDEQKLKNFENILAFRSKLLEAHQVTMLYEALFKVMAENGHLRHSNVFILYEDMKSFSKSLAVQEDSLVDMQRWLERQIAISFTTLSNCSDHISASNLEWACFDLIDKLPEQKHRISAYKAIIAGMKHLNDARILQLAIEMKNLGLNEIKAEFPKAISNLVWHGERCYIRTFCNEYLFAADDGLAYDDNRRRVFTWRNSGEDVNGLWRIQTRNDGKSFSIYNQNVHEYLYAAADDLAFDSMNRRVFTWRVSGWVDNDVWTITPNSDFESFKIFDNVYQGYLFAGSDNTTHDAWRRNVFTLRQNNFPLAGNWKIICE